MDDENILMSMKSALGGNLLDEDYDQDLILHINSIFATLCQLGIGPDTGFSISTGSEQWDDFINGDLTINSVKTYMYQKLRLIFDPPQNSFLVDALKKSTEEYEWRLMVAKDPKIES